jgi:hypothetical protein
MKKYFVLILTFLLGLAFLSGCLYIEGLRLEEALSQYTEWTCEINDDTYFRALDGRGEGYGYITIDGEKRFAFFRLGSGARISVSLINEHGEFFGASISMQAVYRNGKIIVENARMSVGNSQWRDLGRFQFARSEIDRSTVDVKGFSSHSWSSEYLGFSSWQTPTMQANGRATLTENTRNITFVWRFDRHFEIFLGHNADLSIHEYEPIAKGMYTNALIDGTWFLTLTFIEDNLFHFAHSTLVLERRL